MSDQLKIQGVVEMSSDGAEGALNRIGDKAGQMASKVATSAEKAGKAVYGIGDGASRSADEFTRSEGKIVASIKRATTQLELIGKTASQRLEFKINTQGLDTAKFEPLLAKLRELESAQVRAGVAGKGMGQGLQNTSYQLQDFIVQVNGGTDATRALSMQLPQMLVGFGAAGAAIGVVAALLPNLISLFGESADSAKDFKGAMSDFDKAIGNVVQTVRTFDLDPLYEQFNNSTAAVRAATLEQLKFQQEYIRTTQLVANKKFGESIGGLGEYGTLSKFAGAAGSSASENLAKQLGLSAEVAKDLLPVINGLKSGTEDANLVFSKFGTTLLGGNAKAQELAGTLAELAKSDRDAASATSAISEAQGKMAKGHVMTKKEAEAAAKASKVLAKETESLEAILNRINGKDAGFDANYVQTVNKLLLAYDKGRLSLNGFNEAFAAYVAMQPGAKKEAAELAKAQEDYAKALSAGDDALVKQAEKLEQEVEFYGLTESAINNTIIARLEEARAIADANGAYPEHLAYLDREIDARRRIAAASSSLDAKKENERAIKEQARAWEKFSDDIERSLTDSLYRAFEAGDSFGEAFAKSLQNTLKTTVLKLGVSFTMDLGKQLLGGAINSLTGGLFGGSSSGGGGLMSLFSNASNAYSAYGLLTGQTLNNFASAAGSAASWYTGGGLAGEAFGAGVTTTINAGSQAALAAAAEYQAASVAQLALGNAELAAELAQVSNSMAAGASTTGSTLGTLGTAAQTIGLVSLPMIIGGLIDKFGGGDEYKTGMSLMGTFGKDQKGGFDGIIGENYETTSGWFHDGRETVKWTDVDLTVEDMIGMLTGRVSDKADGVMRSKLSDADIQTLLGRVGVVVGEKTVQKPKENPFGYENLDPSGNVRLTEQMVPIFKTAAEMTEDEIRKNWTNLVDTQTYRYIDWEGRDNPYIDGYKRPYIESHQPLVVRNEPSLFDSVDSWGKQQLGTSDSAFVRSTVGGAQGNGEYLVSTNLQVYDFVSESLDKIYESTLDAYRKLGEQLGATDIEAILDSYTGNINIQNLSTLEQLLNGAATQLNEGIGKTIFPIIDEIRAVTGEAGTWADTFSRISGEAAVVSSAFKELGLTMYTSGVANELLATSVALTTAFGGLEGLNAALTSYYDNYYTAEEKRARTLKQLGDALRQGGLEITDSRLGEMSRAEFRSLYESIVETSGAAAPAAIAMLQMQGAFAQLTDAASTSAQKMADAARSLLAQQVTGQIGNNVAGWNAAADAGLAALEQAAQREMARAQAEQQQRQSEMDASREAHNAVINSRIDMEQTRKQLAADSLAAARERASVVARISDVSGRAAADLYRGSDSVGPVQAAAALRQVADMASAARRGALPDADQLARLITSAQSGIGKDGASYYETERDKLVLAGHLSQIEASAGIQLPAAEQAVALAQKQLDSAAEQIELLRKQLITQTTTAELDQRAVTAANQALEAYREQINRLRGVEAATWSLDGSVEDVGKRIVAGLQAQAKTITDSIQAALAAQNISSKDAGAAFQQMPTAAGVMVSNNGAVIAGNKVYRADGVVASTTQAGAEIYGAKREKSAQDFYSWAISAGYSGAMIEKLVGLPAGDMAKWAKANGLPAFAVGTDRVPADMLAMVHQGERITPAAYTGQQEKLIADLITEVRRLQAIVASGNAEARRTADAVNGRPEAPLLVEMA